MLDWIKYISIADKFQFKAKFEDRDDLRQSIILALGRAQFNNNGSGKLPDRSLIHVARYECQKYWRAVKRQSRVASLNMAIEHDEGSHIELGDTLADDSIINLDSWIDAKRRLLDCPPRVLEIAEKTMRGRPLENKEHQYLWRYRRKHPR